jgi:GntR family transcriptional regulator
MGAIDRFSLVPAYRRNADVLRRQISSGEVKAGEKLPSERELCERYDVDRGVVRRALALLQAWLRRGKGCRTAPNHSQEVRSRN